MSIFKNFIKKFRNILKLQNNKKKIIVNINANIINSKLIDL